MWKDLKEYNQYEENLYQNDDKEMVFEMSNFRTFETNLPVDIWVDDAGSNRNNKRSQPRIKFQGFKGKLNSRQGIPLSIEEEPKILIDNPRMELTAKEVGEISDFVKNNLQSLLKLWYDENYGIIAFASEMKPNPKK